MQDRIDLSYRIQAIILACLLISVIIPLTSGAGITLPGGVVSPGDHPVNSIPNEITPQIKPILAGYIPETGSRLSVPIVTQQGETPNKQETSETKQAEGSMRKITTTNSNPYGISWVKTFGGSGWDQANCIRQTSDGGYIVTGYTNSNDGNVTGNHGDDDFWVVKLTSDGDIHWQKCLGGSGDDQATSIQQTSDGGYIVAGYTNSNDGNVTGNHGSDDFWVVKLTSNGDIHWQKCLGGSDSDRASCIQQTSDGGYIVAGYTNSKDGNVTGNHGSDDFWVVKLTGDGNIHWQKCLGGSDSDRASCIQQTSDGGYIVAGYSNSIDGDVVGNHGWTDIRVVKLTSDGEITWKKCFGGGGRDQASSIQQTSDGGYIVAGYTNSKDGNVTGNHGGNDFWVVKLTSNGEITWKKCLGGSDDDEASNVQQTRDGGYIIAGFIADFWSNKKGNGGDYFTRIIKLSSTGKTAWQIVSGKGASSGGAASHFVQQTSDGERLVPGVISIIRGD